MKRLAFLTPGLAIVLVLFLLACQGQETPTQAPLPTPTPTRAATQTPGVILTPTPGVTRTPGMTVTPGVTVTPGMTATPGVTGTPGGGQIAMGQQVFIDMGCGACHTIEGVPGATGQIGPPQNNIGTVAATRRPGLTAEEYIRQSIEEPQAFVVQGYAPVMPQLRGQMTDQEFEALVAFLLAQQ